MSAIYSCSCPVLLMDMYSLPVFLYMCLTLCDSNTYNVHECEQVLLDVLLPVKLDHRVVDAQQHLDVVGPVQALPAHSPRSRVVDTLLHTAVQRLQVHQTAEVRTWRSTRYRVI